MPGLARVASEGEALAPRKPAEAAVEFRGEKGMIPGIAAADLSDDQKKELQKTLNILIGLMEMNRKEFRGHSAQVARQSTLIGRRIGLPPRDVAHISIASYLHDLGKRPDKHFTLRGNQLLLDELLRHVRGGESS